MVKRGKQYTEAAKAVEKDRLYSPGEAVDIAKQTAKAKFDETVELHLRTNSDPRHADQLVRGVALLPHGLGREIRVLVFAAGEAAAAARRAGADYVGDDDLVQRIEEGWLEFDVAMATPDVMGRISRLGRVLGRRGLMPNPRAGTVVQPQDFARAIEEAKMGRVEFRLDRTAIIHVPVGKVSFR
ncbi:50S ribosomal protein L1 [Geodia barretti]|uniref:Ribosomal protein n=1 Tax=Geodia barretti TaxID=519541 RepID=A0AA35RUB4_GEOBA|nr:50S ribosomal protein L1 [Geodia barretti]